MRVERPERRLRRGWGWVDRRYVGLIAAAVRGERVLDLGSGYGTVTAALGTGAVGVDADPAAVETASRLHPGTSFAVARGATLPFEDAGFDTIVLRDSLHHLVNDEDWPATRSEIMRVLTPRGRVVVLDPNINLLLRIARRVIRHDDEECPVERARAVLGEAGLRVSHESFHTLFTLPLSGGYVGPELLPPWPRLWQALLAIESAMERLAAAAGLARFVTWRYLIVAERA